MAAIFSRVAPLIIAAENGEVDDPNDHGGLTKYGISQAQYQDIDIKSLTPDKALDILEKDYWDRYRLGELENQGIANQLFFMFVNMNPKQAALIAQISINACGRSIIKVIQDGVLGSTTIKALNSLADGWLSNRMRLELIGYYLHLTDKDASQIKFFRGWVRRALS